MSATQGSWAMLVAAAVLSTVGSACSDSTGLSGPTVVPTVSAVEVSVDDGTVSGSMTLSVENQGPQAITFLECGAFLERLVGPAWTRVWSQPCLLAGPDVVQLGAGAEHTFRVILFAELGQYPAEGWDVPISGQYRARLPVFIPEELTILPTSRSFRLD